MRTDVNASDCARGVYGHRVRESALKVDTGRKIPFKTALGNRTCVGGVPVRCSNHLSYIPTSQESRQCIVVCQEGLGIPAANFRLECCLDSQRTACLRRMDRCKTAARLAVFKLFLSRLGELEVAE